MPPPRSFAAPLLLVLALLPGPRLAGQTPSGPSLARAAAGQVGVTVFYDPSYVRLRYPNGDAPPERGVCADVVVRAFRGAGVDLQAEVHEDMRKIFGAYPRHGVFAAPIRTSITAASPI